MVDSRETYTARERAHVLTELAPIFGKLYTDMIEIVPPDSVDLQIAAKKLQPNYFHGIALLYGAGLAAWQTMRDKLEDVDVSQYFSPEHEEHINRYMFNVTPERVTSAFMQSAMTAPSIFMAWWGDAANVCDRNVPGKLWCHELGTDRTLENLSMPWFSSMLRRGSVTSSGLYRNSTGLELGFKSHMIRSAKRPMLAFEADTNGKIVSIEEGSDAQLSNDFTHYLHQRLRTHNRAISANTSAKISLVDGTSVGCPMAHGPGSRSDVFASTSRYLATIIKRAE